MLNYKLNKFSFEGSVVLDIDNSDKYLAFKELIKKAPIFNKIKDKQNLLDAVCEREKERCTGFNHGVAVAHGRSKYIKKIGVALGISRKGVIYDSPDKKPVHILFLIATPQNKTTEYLKILSILMAITHNSSIREKLLNFDKIEAIETFLKNQFLLTCQEKSIKI